MFSKRSKHEDGVVVFNPVTDGNGAVLRGGHPDDDLIDPCIDDLTLAHGTAHCVIEQLVCPGVTAYQIDRGSNHITSGCGDDGVCFCVDTAAELIALTGGDMQSLTGANSQITAVTSAAWRTVVAGGDNLVIAYDDGTVWCIAPLICLIKQNYYKQSKTGRQSFFFGQSGIDFTSEMS